MPVRRMSRRSIIGAAVCLVISTSLLGCQSTSKYDSSPDSKEDVRAVQQTVDSWLNKAIAHLDTAAVPRYLTPTLGSTEPAGWCRLQERWVLSRTIFHKK